MKQDPEDAMTVVAEAHKEKESRFFGDLNFLSPLVAMKCTVK